MAGYKLQGKTKEGDTVDIPLVATYDKDGNDIANQFEELKAQLADNEHSIAVKVIRFDEWITLSEEIGVETYIFPYGVNSSNTEAMKYLEPIYHTTRSSAFVLKITTFKSKERVWEFASSRNDWGKEVYIWGQNDNLGYDSMVNGKPNWKKILTVGVLSEVIETDILKDYSSFNQYDMTTKQYFLLPDYYPIDEETKAFLPKDYDTSRQAMFTISAAASCGILKLQDVDKNIWIGKLIETDIDWVKLANVDDINVVKDMRENTVNYYKVKMTDTIDDLLRAMIECGEDRKNITYLFPVRYDINKLKGDFYQLPDDVKDFECGGIFSITFNHSTGSTGHYSSYSRTMTYSDNDGGFWFGWYNDKSTPNSGWRKLGSSGGDVTDVYQHMIQVYRTIKINNVDEIDFMCMLSLYLPFEAKVTKENLLDCIKDYGVVNFEGFVHDTNTPGTAFIEDGIHPILYIMKDEENDRRLVVGFTYTYSNIGTSFYSYNIDGEDFYVNDSYQDKIQRVGSNLHISVNGSDVDTLAFSSDPQTQINKKIDIEQGANVVVVPNNGEKLNLQPFMLYKDIKWIFPNGYDKSLADVLRLPQDLDTKYGFTVQLTHDPIASEHADTVHVFWRLQDFNGNEWTAAQNYDTVHDNGRWWKKTACIADIENVKSRIKTRAYDLTLSSSGTNQDVWFYCDDVDLTGAVGCQIEFTNGSKNRGFKGVAGVPKFNGKTDTFDDVLGTFTGVELNNNNNFTFWATVSTCITQLDGASHKVLNVRMVKAHCKTISNQDCEFRDYTGIDNSRCVLTVYYQD